MKEIENGLTLDDYGIQMPWYTRPALAVIDKWDLRGKLIFEFGVGYSSLWYSSRGACTFGVDSNNKWTELAQSGWVANDHDRYVCSIDIAATASILVDGQLFDIVVIDGDYRDDCTVYALKNLKPGGKLILDNWLQKTVEPEWPKTQKIIEGMPIELYYEPGHWDNWCTAIVTKV